MSTRAEKIEAYLSRKFLPRTHQGLSLELEAADILALATPTAYVSIKDVADLTGRTKGTLLSWLRRGQHDCPPPLGETAGGQVWDRQDWVDWVALHPGLVFRTYPARPVRDAPQA